MAYPDMVLTNKVILFINEYEDLIDAEDWSELMTEAYAELDWSQAIELIEALYEILPESSRQSLSSVRLDLLEYEFMKAYEPWMNAGEEVNIWHILQKLHNWFGYSSKEVTEFAKTVFGLDIQRKYGGWIIAP